MGDDTLGETIEPQEDKKEQKEKKKPHIVSRFFYFIVGFIGNMMLLAATVIGLFIFWQIQWTTWEANAHQEASIEYFENTEHFVASPNQVGVERRDEPPKMSHVSHGQYIGMINIPAIHGDKWSVIAEGSGLDVIDMGYFGRYNNTRTYPGEVGNFSMAAHRLSYGSGMMDIDKVKVGDSVIVETNKYYYVYKVLENPIDVLVNPSQVEVISADPYQARQLIAEGKDWRTEDIEVTRRFLTITSCHPAYVSSHRIILHAEFDYWMDKEDGKPKELVG